MRRENYPIWLAMGAMILVWSNHASAQAYKCKNANGTTEFSDQPCRGTTAKSVEKEYISESQRRSSISLGGKWRESECHCTEHNSLQYFGYSS